MTTRRNVLKFGLAGALLLASGGVALGLRGTVLRAPAGPLLALDATEFSVLWAIAERVCPANGAFPAASSLHVAEKVDALVARLADGDAAEFKQALRLVENALPGLLLDGRTSTFTGASAEVQDRVLENMRTSRIPLRRTLFKALSGLVGATYYAQPEVWGALGYPGPPDALRRPSP